MNGWQQHLSVSLRLHFRNRMALIYGYLFPLIFLVAFAVLYRFDRVPLVRHLGELLTVTILGGACFGLPTTMVSERERGVWRRYRLAPVATATLMTSTLVARYVAVFTAGLLQLALAMVIGMPFPRHPLELWLAFTCVTFAFLGLGLVIAMLADNVPAVQGLGQCIFLPMLIIGGVAVQLASLPDWALHVSAFFPGRYAVQAMQACTTAAGLGPVRFSLLALLLIGAAGCLAGSMMFRWDAQQRFSMLTGKGWLAVPLAAWLAVGGLAEARGHVGLVNPSETSGAAATAAAIPAPRPAVLRTPTLAPAETGSPATAPVTSAPPARPSPSARPDQTAAAKARPEPGSSAAPAPRNGNATPAKASAPPGAMSDPQAMLCSAAPPTWQAVTVANIDADLSFDKGLPPDSGVVTPIGRDDAQPEPEVDQKLQKMAQMLPQWRGGQVFDPIQRLRNYLYVMAVPDVFQLDVERYVPAYVFDQIVQSTPRDDLVKMLYWVACTPGRGADPTVEDMRALGLPGVPGDIEEVRTRAGIYAVKLLGRLLGRIT